MDGPQDRTEYDTGSSGRLRVALGGFVGALVYFAGSSMLGIPLAPALVGGLVAGILAKKQAYVLLVGFPLVFLVMLHSLIGLSGVFLVGKLVGTILNVSLMGVGVFVGATLADDTEEESEAIPDYRMLK